MSIRSARLLLALALVASCSRDRAREQEWFVDRAAEAGLDLVHANGMSGQFYFPEPLPPGVALLDYDNDGDLDVYFVQSGSLGGKTPLRGRLFRNDGLHFTDVTAQSGIDARGYGMGVATGDFDNNGCVDLYLTFLGRNQLFRNNCNGTFTDVSKESGTDDPGWSVSAAFVDYDRDGWLDLFVGHYVNWSVETDRKCTDLAGAPSYCPPQVYQAQPSHLFHNNRNGTFSDVTAAAGLAGEFGPALGVVTADFDGDGWIDIYVANDGQENQLWINQRNGTFKNTALLSGVALTADGKAEASMGVDAGDFDNDGDEDLIMTELNGEGSNLYVNDGTAMFDDRSARSGVGTASLQYTGFGTSWFDFDNDGWLDILAVNGRIQAAEGRTNRPFPLDQRKLLLRNLGNGQFEDVSARAGAVFDLSEVGRGAAFGDIDNDGDTDVVIANDAGRPRLLINNIGMRNHWLGLRLVGNGGRDMVGARVGVVRKNGPTFWRRARADGSYASANDPRVLVGLGQSTEPPTIRVRWPSGRTEEWPAVPIDRYTTLKEGSGR